jgi:hypothetical protein
MKKIQNESGQSLVLALIVISVLMIAVVSVSLFARTDVQSSQKQIEQTSAYYIAEAGLQRAIEDTNASLANKQPPPTSISDLNFNGGSYQVTITPKTNAHGENIGYDILSIGKYKDETKKISAYVRPRLTRTYSALNYALYAEKDMSIKTLSGLLGIGLLQTHKIQVNGKVHGNGNVNIKHEGLLLVGNPTITDKVSSTSLSNIQVPGLPNSQKVETPYIPMPSFDFDRAREMAKKEGKYISHSVGDISLLGIGPNHKIIFIDGDLTLAGLDLLGISLANRTFVVNGTFTGLLEVGGISLADIKLNIIAKENINFVGAVTGLQVNGILFAQGDNRNTNQPDPNLGKISVAGHCAVKGYTGARNISMGAGLLSSILGLVTGKMEFTYNPTVFNEGYLPSGLGFKDNVVEIVSQEVVP